MPTQPISPTELATACEKEIPGEVFEVFNDLMKLSWDGTQAVVNQDDAASMIAKRLGITTSDVFKMRYMDVEEHYRKKGWVVTYDKPGYCEAGEATFVFKKPVTRG